MSETTLHTVLINRKWIGVLQDYFRMKGIKEHHTLRNNHGELKKYETMFGRKLTRIDAIIISPLTQQEIDEITENYHSNQELLKFQEKENEERLKIYYENYGEDNE